MKECYQREQSIVPQQALALSNAALPHDTAARIVARLSAAGSIAAGPIAAGPDDSFIERAFVMVLDRRPSAGELDACRSGLEQWRRLGAESGATESDPARVHLVWALLNHNDFVTLR